MEPIVITKEDEINLSKKHPGAPTILQSRRKKSQHTRGGKVQNRVAGKRNYYSEQEKMDAACKFAVTGNCRRVSELTGIGEATIRGWKSQEWWLDIQSAIVREQDETLDVKLTNLVDKAVDSVNDRLEHGDYIYDTKRGSLVRKPVNAKDLAIVTAITIDKRQLIRGLPTSRVEKVSTDARLEKLAIEFRKFSLSKTIQGELVNGNNEETQGEDEDLTEEVSSEESGITIEN